MKTPSTANHSLTPTKPNTGSNPMKSTKTSRFSKPAHILVGSILALVALPAQPAQAGTPLITDGLKGYWSFDASTAVDDKGFGTAYDGTAHGTVVYDTDVPAGTTGRSANMTAVNTAIAIGTVNSAASAFFEPGSALTLSFWTKGTNPMADWGYWITKDGDGPGGYRLTQAGGQGNNQMALFTRGAGDGAKMPHVGHPWNNTNAMPTWNHFVVTFGSSAVKIYQNGELRLTGGMGSTINPSLSPVVFGGRIDPSNGQLGNTGKLKMDEVYIFDRAVTAAEALTLYAPSNWDGGPGNWTDSMWNTTQAPVASRNMWINAASSNVALDADFSSQHLNVGSTTASTLTINSTKTLTLAGVATVGASGTLQVDGTLATPYFISSGNVAFSAGGTVNATNVRFTGGTSSGSGTAVSINSTGDYIVESVAVGSEVQVPQAQHTVTVGANLAGTGGLRGRIVPWGAGRTVLTGTNTYTGPTSIGRASGILRADDGVGLPSASNLDLTNAYKQHAGMETGANLVRPGGSGAGQMRINMPDGGGFTAIGAVAGGNPVVVCFGTLATPEALTWDVGNFRVGWSSGSFALNGAHDPANNTIDFRNPINLGDGSNNKKGNILVDSITYPATMSGVLSGTAGANPNLKKNGAGVLILTGINTYSGTTQVTAGTLVAANADALGTTGANTTVSSGATLDVRAALVAESISVTGTGVGAAGALITAATFTGSVAGPVTLTGNTSIGGAGTLAINGAISGGSAVTKVGTGATTFAGANTSYSGLTTVSGGTLVAAHADALGTTGANTTVSSGATLDVRAALVAEPIRITGTGVGGFGALITAATFTGTVIGELTLTGAASIGGAGSTGTLNINGLVTTGGNTLTTLGTGVTTFGAASDLTSLTNLVVTDGTTNVNSALGTAGNAVVTVSDSPVTKLRFGSVSQTLTSLTIGAGATVIFTSGLASGALTGDDGGSKAAGFGSPASSFGGGATVPEPGTLGLLLVGALGMLNRRRRA